MEIHPTLPRPLLIHFPNSCCKLSLCKSQHKKQNTEGLLEHLLTLTHLWLI